MAAITSFEDLVAWQKARMLCREIYLLTRQSSVARDFGFCSQIQRAAVSAMSNVAEGFERGGRPEFAQMLSIAKGSSGEVRSLLYVGLDAGHLSDERFGALNAQAIEVSRVIGGLRNAVAKQRDATRKTSAAAQPSSGSTLSRVSALSPQSSNLETPTRPEVHP